MNLGEKLEDLGRVLGEREAEHVDDLKRAQQRASELREVVDAALLRFRAAVAKAGSDHLDVQLGPVHLDDKHIRSSEFDLRRGRHRAIVTVKSRGEVTLVGPFHAGKTEGPCRSFPIDSAGELEEALGGFLERFLEQAMTP